MEQFANLKNAALRLPPAKLGTLGVVAITVLALIAWIAARPAEPLGILYSGLDPAEGGRIMQRLEELKIPADARGDGTTILIPNSQVARVRMELAASGLPHLNGAGYELLDSQSPMNMTSFMQRVQRLRALEGELARTISTLDGVRTARVHIVLPERESFARDTPKPTASVAVTMSGPERLTPSQAAAIRLLVAGAVPRLKQEDVSILDPSGVVLAAEDGDALAVSRIDEMKAAEEQKIQRAVLALLEPFVGHDKVRAIASVDIDETRETQREEKFDPLSQVERSRQTQNDSEKSDETRPGDPVTVGQNVPNQQVGGNNDRSTTTSTRQGETINYEISSTVDEKIREPGRIRRLTVAVVVDGLTDAQGKFQPRPQEELTRLTDLVRSAVGFDEKRGDRISVDTLPFVAEDSPGTETPTAIQALTGSPTSIMAVGGGAVVLLLAAGGGFLLAWRRRQRNQRTELARLEAERQAQQMLEAPHEEMVTLASMEGAIRASFISELNQLVDHRLDESVAVIRVWIAESSRA